MKRITIFAHFDKQNIIDPYVIDYLRELKKYSEIIFVSDGDLQKKETEKIKDLCFDVIAKKHGEYDFGSYKRGFQLIQEKYPQKLQKIDELLFINDSCYLIGSFKKIFADMAKKQDCDFWGLAGDYDNLKENNIHYIGTFFMAFRKEVFLEKFFQDFILSITKQSLRDSIIYKYEIGLSKLLKENNKKSFCYFSRENIGNNIVENYLKHSQNITQTFNQNINLSRSIIATYLDKIFNINTINYLHSDKFYFFIKNEFPLIKRRVLGYKNFPKERLLFLWQEILEKDNKLEIVEKIKNHCNRIGFKLKNKSNIKNRLNLFLYFLSYLELFYIKKYLKNGKEVTTIKLLFFKIKINRYKRFGLFGIRIWKK